MRYNICASAISKFHFTAILKIHTSTTGATRVAHGVLPFLDSSTSEAVERAGEKFRYARCAREILSRNFSRQARSLARQQPRRSRVLLSFDARRVLGRFSPCKEITPFLSAISSPHVPPAPPTRALHSAFSIEGPASASISDDRQTNLPRTRDQGEHPSGTI